MPWNTQDAWRPFLSFYNNWLFREGEVIEQYSVIVNTFGMMEINVYLDDARLGSYQDCIKKFYICFISS